MHKRAVLPLVLAITLVSFIGCQPPERIGWPMAVTGDELAAAGLGYYWRNVVTLEEEESLMKLWRVDENVYALTSTNRLVAFNASTGERKWVIQAAQPGLPVFEPTHADRVTMPERPGPGLVSRDAPAETFTADIVILVNPTDAIVCDRADGRLLHRIDFSQHRYTANTSAGCDGERIYVGSFGRFYAVDLATGLVSWKANAGELVSARPRVMGNLVYVASQSGTISATRVAVDEPTRLWPVPFEPQASGPFVADFTLTPRALYAGCQDYSIYCFDPISGQQLWRFRCGGPVSEPVQMGQTNLYARGDGDALYAIDLATGERAKWTLEEGLSVLTEVGPTAYVLAEGRRMLAVNAAIGEVRTIVPLTGLDLFVSNPNAGAIFAGNRDGLVCRISPADAGEVTPAMITTKPQP